MLHDIFVHNGHISNQRNAEQYIGQHYDHAFIQKLPHDAKGAGAHRPLDADLKLAVIEGVGKAGIEIDAQNQQQGAGDDGFDLLLGTNCIQSLILTLINADIVPQAHGFQQTHHRLGGFAVDLQIERLQFWPIMQTAIIIFLVAKLCVLDKLIGQNKLEHIIICDAFINRSLIP